LAVAEDFEKQSKHRLSAAGQIYSLMARNLAEWGESEKAIQYALKGLQLSEQWGLLVAITGSLDCLGRILVFCQKQEQVRPIFQRSDDLAQKISPRYWQETALYNLETMLYCDGFDDDISHLLHRLQESNAQFSPILNAKLLIRNKQPDEALSLLEGVLSDLSGFSSFKTVRIHTLRAIAYQALRDEKHALDALRQALELGETENRVATFVSEGDEMEKLLRLAQPKTTTPKFVQQLLQAFESRHILKPQPDIVREALIEPLSEREMDILKLLAQGCSDRVIAKTLVIAPDTVHKHLQKIYSKLDVHTRMEAILRARDLGLL
jgi:ATP/maltotriose-dependent transcriptional regulator MalT